MIEKRVLVKNISNLSDARYCAGMGVEYLSFCIDKDNEEYVNSAKIKEITGWLSGVKIIIETNDFNLEVINEVKELVEIDGFLTKSISLIEKLKAMNDNVILEFESQELPFEKVDGVTNLILNTTNMDANFLEKINSNYKNLQIFIGYELQSENLEFICNNFPDFGFALIGSKELRPGFKNYDSLVNTLELLDMD
jgi:phosphoribosylanthranilate isomerase